MSGSSAGSDGTHRAATGARDQGGGHRTEDHVSPCPERFKRTEGGEWLLGWIRERQHDRTGAHREVRPEVTRKLQEPIGVGEPGSERRHGEENVRQEQREQHRLSETWPLHRVICV